MNGELLAVLEAIERDKGIDREVLIQAVESALAMAARKTVGASEEQEVTVTIDRQTGALSVSSDHQEIKSLDFSRIAAQTAKQVIIQKIREAEREVVFTEFQSRIGDIVTGTVHRFERGDIIVELGRAEAILPKPERIPHEDYHQGDQLQGFVLDVRRTTRGPAIVLSRTHEGFIRGLFALEVPEIAEGIVQIKGIAREAGDRTKIAVYSTDEKVDCVGACVGMRGTRVKNIVRELHGEKVDIIRWHEEVKEYVAAALSPAKISEIQQQADTMQAIVIVDDDQLSLAIGKRGQNVRLASKLTGWQLEIRSRVQLTTRPVAEIALGSVAGIGPALQEKLLAAGITTAQQLSGMTLEQLQAVKGVGEKTAPKILHAAHEALAQAEPNTVAVPEPTTQAQPGAAAAGADTPAVHATVVPAQETPPVSGEPSEPDGEPSAATAGETEASQPEPPKPELPQPEEPPQPESEVPSPPVSDIEPATAQGETEPEENIKQGPEVSLPPERDAPADDGEKPQERSE